MSFFILNNNINIILEMYLLKINYIVLLKHDIKLCLMKCFLYLSINILHYHIKKLKSVDKKMHVNKLCCK